MKKFLSLVLALALSLAIAPPARAVGSPFRDVPDSHWAYQDIMAAYSDGAVQGISANSYNPNGNVTMAQFIAILTRAFCSDWVEIGETLAAEGAVWYVPDGIAADAWYTPNYIAAEEYSLLWEIPSNSPEVEVTREVMAQIMYNLLSGHLDGVEAVGSVTYQKLQETKNKIPDFSSVSESMKDAVATCYSLGLITGIDSTGRFSPKDRMSRAQTAAIYARLKTVMETGTGIAPAQTGNSTNPTGTLTNGKPITEDNVRALLEEYKHGKTPVWPAVVEAGFTSLAPDSTYPIFTRFNSTLDAAYGGEPRKQVNLAFVISDELFGNSGNNPMRQLDDFSEVRPGDLLDMGGGFFSFAADRPVSRDGFLYVTTIGNTGMGTINWHEGDIGRVCINANYKRALTRYPEGTETSPLTVVSTPGSTSNTSTDDFSQEYMSGKFYQQLKNVTLTGDYRKDILAIAASQIGYSEGNYENQIDGFGHGGGNFSEYGRYMGSNGTAWCSEFASWCARMAGVPNDILHSSRSANVQAFGAPYYSWNQTVFAGGSYAPKPGDLALFAWHGTSVTEKNLSHTAIVHSVAVYGNTATITVIDGNANSTVQMHDYTASLSDGNVGKGYLAYFVAPEYD